MFAMLYCLCPLQSRKIYGQCIQFGLTNLVYGCHSVQIVFCLISVKLCDEWAGVSASYITLCTYLHYCIINRICRGSLVHTQTYSFLLHPGEHITLVYEDRHPHHGH